MRLLLSPPTQQIQGQIHLSSSKSESNRVLIINALAGNRLLLDNLSDARDTQTMKNLLKSPEAEVWDVLDAGTTMRFCTAYLAIHGESNSITGTPRMKERPIGLLVDALRTLGAEINYLEKEGYPPLSINKIKKQKSDLIKIPGNVSSQYISALLMIAPTLERGITIEFTSEVFSRPYIEMTLGLMQKFGVGHIWSENKIIIHHTPYKSGNYRVESDWSGASYWYSIAAISQNAELFLPGLRKESLQGDQQIDVMMSKMGVQSSFEHDGVRIRHNPIYEKQLEINFKTCPDLAQTVMVTAACKGIGLQMTGLESLKIKETDRVAAMQNELRKLGAKLIENESSWELIPGKLPERIDSIRTYEDHRMAMAFAPIASIKEVSIEEPEVVKKSYPGFWKALESTGIMTKSEA